MGEVLFDNAPKTDIITEIEGFSTSTPIYGEKLTREQKSKIDKWLEANGYNRYGDIIGAIYASGTPLFDRVTGVAIDRFDYILLNHRDILDKIKR